MANADSRPTPAAPFLHFAPLIGMTPAQIAERLRTFGMHLSSATNPSLRGEAGMLPLPVGGADVTAAAPTSAPERALFEPFAWTDVRKAHELGAHADAADMVFAGRVRDVARGLVVTLRMLEHVALDRARHDPPLLDDDVAGDLQRLAIAASEMLDAEAERKLENVAHRVAVHDANAAPMSQSSTLRSC